MENNKNEIDLMELLIKIYLYLKKYWWIMLIGIVTGIVFTFAFGKSDSITYRSSMIISAKPDKDYMYAITFKEFSNRYEKNPAEAIVGIIDQAEGLIKDGDINRLAEKMNLSVSDLKGLKSISSEYKIEKGEAPGNIVNIFATSVNRDVYNKLGKGIVYLINHNTYVQNKNSEDSLMLLNMVKQIDVKLKELDSLQTKFLKNGKINDLIIFKDNSFFGESVMLNSLKEKLKNELQNIEEAKIVEDFYLPKPKPETKSIKIPLLINIVIFLFLSILLIFFIIFNKKAKLFEQNRRQ
jgi:hypothetical protein